MFKIGVVVADKNNWPESISLNSEYSFRILESKPVNGNISVVQDSGLRTVDKDTPGLLDIIHLCFAGMRKRDVLRQLRFAGQHPTLFTKLAIVLCEVDLATGFEYEFISTYLQKKCRHRLHIDYFLILSTVDRKERGGLRIQLHSGHQIINTTIEVYYNKVLAEQTAPFYLESNIV